MPTEADNKAALDDAARKPIDVGPLARMVGYALRRAQLAVFDEFMAAFAELGLRPAQYAVLVLLCVLLVVATAHGSKAPKAPPKPTNDECLVCHGDAGLATERDGKPVSLAVNPDTFKNSMHGTILSDFAARKDSRQSFMRNLSRGSAGGL